MSNVKIKFGVVGQGHIGKRHSEMIRFSKDAELIAVCDEKPKTELGIDDITENFYHSLTELINAHPEIEVINICTPNGLHASQSIEALKDRKSTRLNSSHIQKSRMPSSA